MHIIEIQEQLQKWFMRKTIDSAIRRVGKMPISIGTDIGSVRSENQDRVGVVRFANNLGKEFTVCVLCDGMGGMVEGADCASITISAFFACCYENRNLDPEKMLELSAQHANNLVYAKYLGLGGSTLSAVLINENGNAIGVNVGDSRIYKEKSHYQLNQITVDDTLAGQLNVDNIYSGNNLLQYIGIGSDLEPHLIEIPENDSLNAYLLLASDGVHFLPHEMLELILFNSKDFALASKRLIELSKWSGGRDNASIITISLASYNEFKNLTSSNILEVWDPFGELQILLLEGSASRTSTTPTKIVGTLTENIPKAQRKKQSKKTKPKIQADKLNITAQNEAEKNFQEPTEVPQLIIEFNKIKNE